MLVISQVISFSPIYRCSHWHLHFLGDFPLLRRIAGEYTMCVSLIHKRRWLSGQVSWKLEVPTMFDWRWTLLVTRLYQTCPEQRLCDWFRRCLNQNKEIISQYISPYEPINRISAYIHVCEDVWHCVDQCIQDQTSNWCYMHLCYI